MLRLFDKESAAKWDTLGAYEYSQSLIPGDAAETAKEMKEAKKAKSKVARKLLFAFKRQQEDVEAESMDQLTDNVTDSLATQKAMGHSMKDMSSRMERMERLMERMTTGAPSSRKAKDGAKTPASSARAPASSAPQSVSV